MIKLVNEGISIIDGHIVYNTAADSENDIMHTVTPDIYESRFFDNTYYFGYTFRPEASGKNRTAVIHWLKGIGEQQIEQKALTEFIAKPVSELLKRIDFNEISCIICPRSGRSNLVKAIMQCLGKMLPHGIPRNSYEVVKTLPSEIQFDFESFEDDFQNSDKNAYNQMYDYVVNTLIPNIKKLDYFSIAANVKPKYRQYIMNYLKIESEEAEKAIRSISSGSVLIVDDINTSGATLHEIIRIVRSLNPSCNIYIFTLIGRGTE